MLDPLCIVLYMYSLYSREHTPAHRRWRKKKREEEVEEEVEEEKNVDLCARVRPLLAAV